MKGKIERTHEKVETFNFIVLKKQILEAENYTYDQLKELMEKHNKKYQPLKTQNDPKIIKELLGNWVCKDAIFESQIADYPNITRQERGKTASMPGLFQRVEVLKRQLDSIQTVAEQSKSNHISGDGVCTCKIKCDDINIDFTLNDAPKHALNSIKATLSSIIADFYSIFR